MSALTLEILIVLVLFLANGVFAMSEMAVGIGLVRREPKAVADQLEAPASSLS